MVWITTFLAIGLVGATDVPAESWGAGAWSMTKSGTKKALTTTVDLVTLKPVRRTMFPPAKVSNDLKLGFKPDPRKAKKSSSGSWFGSLFRSKPSEPETVEDFFSLERPRQ